MEKRQLQLNATNVFAIGTREGYKFETTKGERTISDLWGIPLTDEGKNNGYDLTTLYRNLKSAISYTNADDDFLEEVTAQSEREKQARKTLENKLEIVATIILYKKEKAKEIKNQSLEKARAELAKKLLEERKLSEMNNLSDDELAKLAGK